MTEAPKVVAITGASGYIGARLLQHFEEDRSVGKLVAFDLKPPPFPIHNIAVYRQDVAEPIDETLRRHRVNTLVHLASIRRGAPGYQDWAQVFQHNQDALKSTLQSCAAAGVEHLIYVSSHSVYGAFSDNPVPLTELAEARCYENVPYGYANLEFDRDVRAFADNHSEVKVTILRACTVLGPSDEYGLVARTLPRRFLGVGSNPPFQFLHEADLVRIIGDIIHRGTPGVFNVAGEGVVFLQELAEITHRKLVHLPTFLAYPAAWLSWKLLRAGAGTAELDAARYPVIMSTGKIKQALDCRFNYTSMETVTTFANYAGL